MRRGAIKWLIPMQIPQICKKFFENTVEIARMNANHKFKRHVKKKEEKIDACIEETVLIQFIGTNLRDGDASLDEIGGNRRCACK